MAINAPQTKKYRNNRNQTHNIFKAIVLNLFLSSCIPSPDEMAGAAVVRSLSRLQNSFENGQPITEKEYLGQVEYVNSDLNVSSNKVIDQFPYGECRITDRINLTVKSRVLLKNIYLGFDFMKHFKLLCGLNNVLSV